MHGVTFVEVEDKLDKQQKFLAKDSDDECLKSNRQETQGGLTSQNRSFDSSPSDVYKLLPLRSTDLKTSQSKEEADKAANQGEAPN